MIISYKLTFVSINTTRHQLYIAFLKQTFKKLQWQSTFVDLKIKNKRLTLLKSPHVYKKSREQFQIQTVKTIIVINNMLSPSVLKFVALNKPVDLKFTIKRLT